VAVKEQVTRVLLERLIVNRPPSMGTAHHLHRASSRIKGSGHLILLSLRPEIEKVFESRPILHAPPGAQRTTLVGGEEQ
jgi:hypothetical protein